MSYSGGSTSLKYFKRLKIYKNSTDTVSFNLETKVGRSYRWDFVGLVEGKLVFNDYKWSTTTSSHQSAVRSVLRDLGLKYIIGDFGPENIGSLGRHTVERLLKQYEELSIKIESATKKTSWAQQWRERSLKEVLEAIQDLESLSPRFKVSKKRRLEIKNAAEEAELNRVSELESEKCFKFLSLKEAASNLNEVEL